MKRFLSLLLLAALLLPVSTGCHRKNDARAKIYFADMASITPDERTGEVPIFHYWRDLRDGEYLFGAPSPDSIATWKALCESCDTIDAIHKSVIIDVYRSLNQFVTYQDLLDLWHFVEAREYDDDLTLWRLAQYKPCRKAPASEAERFGLLQDAISDLTDFDGGTQFELNWWSWMSLELDEFYNRILDREILRRTDGDLKAALSKESGKWHLYHAQLDSTYMALTDEPNGWAGSAWPMSIAGILEDDANARAVASGELLFTIADGRLETAQEKHIEVSDEKIHEEFRVFMHGLVKEEYLYPVPVRREALAADMRAWDEWMASRGRVSALLSGDIKEVFDNATNNLRRHKLIMLRNCYEGYGVTSHEVLEHILYYDVPDEVLDTVHPFMVRWEAYCDSLRRATTPRPTAD